MKSKMTEDSTIFHNDGCISPPDTLSHWLPLKDRIKILKDSHIPSLPLMMAAVVTLKNAKVVTKATGMNKVHYRLAWPSLRYKKNILPVPPLYFIITPYRCRVPEFDSELERSATIDL